MGQGQPSRANPLAGFKLLKMADGSLVEEGTLDLKYFHNTSNMPENTVLAENDREGHHGHRRAQAVG